MKTFKVLLYPNVESYLCVVEADSVDEARTIAEEEATRNCFFMAMDEDIKELKRKV